MSDPIIKRHITTSELEGTFTSQMPDAPDFTDLANQISRIETLSASGAVVGAAIQRSMTALTSTLAASGVTCDDSKTGEPPSAMQAHYRNGKVVFTCYHNPPHEFEIDVTP